MKSTCSAFSTTTGGAKRGESTAHPITGHSKSLGTTGYVDDFSCRILVAKVREPRRWRPPATHRCRGAKLAWSGASEEARGNKARGAQS